MSTISNINQALVDERVVSALRSLKPALDAFTYKVELGKVYNDIVRVPVSVDPTVDNKTLGVLGTKSGSLTGVNVTLDQKKEAIWGVKEGEIAGGLFANWWADAAAGAVHNLGKTVVDAALAEVTASNFGDNAATDKHVVALADFRQTDLAQLWKKAIVKIKNQPVSFGMGPGAAAAVFGETNLGAIFSNTGTNWFATGIVPQLIGMKTWMYTEFPSNSENLEAAMFGKAAIAVGIATAEMLADSGEGDTVDRRIITDPETGLQALYTVGFGQGGQLTGSMWLMYGIKKVQNAVVRYVSA